MRIFLHPGIEQSQNDGDWHYIGAVQLARLYKVPLLRCIVLRTESDKHGFIPQKGDVHLYPQYFGDYEPVFLGEGSQE